MFKIIKPIQIYGRIILLFTFFFLRNDANAQNYTVGVFVCDTVASNMELEYDEEYASVQVDSALFSYVTGLRFQVKINEVRGFVSSNGLDTLQVGDTLTIPVENDSSVLQISVPEENSFVMFDILVIGTPIVAGEVYYCNISYSRAAAYCCNTLEVYPVNDETCNVQPNVSVDRNPKDPRPGEFKLNQNYPNPFNPATTISYSLSENGYVKIKVYNIKGEMITTLLNQLQEAGNHQVVWNGCEKSGNRASNGVYYYQIKTDGFTMTKKMVLLR